MPLQIVRARFCIAVEGESEQSFIRWIQRISEEHLRIHLDTILLGGGGYKTMLENAIRQHKRRCATAGTYKHRFLMVDGDREKQGDWPIDDLRGAAAKANFMVFVQRPNHEGLLLKMMPGMERENADAASAQIKLKSQWPTYRKPANANTLTRKFSLHDLLRAANFDPDLKNFLGRIGLIKP